MFPHLDCVVSQHKLYMVRSHGHVKWCLYLLAEYKRAKRYLSRDARPSSVAQKRRLLTTSRLSLEPDTSQSPLASPAFRVTTASRCMRTRLPLHRRSPQGWHTMTMHLADAYGAEERAWGLRRRLEVSWRKPDRNWTLENHGADQTKEEHSRQRSL